MIDVLCLFVILLSTSGVLSAWPQAGQNDLLIPRFHAAFFQPGMDASLDELRDFGDVLQTGA